MVEYEHTCLLLDQIFLVDTTFQHVYVFQVTASSHVGASLEDMQSNGNEMNSDEDDDYIMDDEDGSDDDNDLEDTDEDDGYGNNGGHIIP
jgi:hypothetical protein